MSVLDRIMNELDELYIVEHVTRKHDEARMQYHLSSLTVSNDHEFHRVIGDYYNYHFSKCISSGGKLSNKDAADEAKNIVFGAYQRRQKDKLEAYSDGKRGTNGGMRAILDIIMEFLKEKSINIHVKDVIDRYIQPSSFEEQKSIVKELLSRTGELPSHIDKSQPEKYARDYEQLIRLLMEIIKNLSSKLRMQ